MNTTTLERFFSKQCTPEEAMQVALYLKANPLVLEKYLSVHEWNVAALEETIPAGQWEEMWRNIQHTNKIRTLKKRTWLAAAAACFAALAGGVILYLQPAQPLPGRSQNIAAVVKQPQTEKVFNHSNKILTLVLEDGSVVKLSPNAVVQYSKPFAPSKRDIYLKGTAAFHVAKNKLRPFTVYEGNFATTALGTIFTVKENTTTNVITVKLIEGKVVIRSTVAVPGWNNDVYLLAGEQMQFDAARELLAVKPIQPSNALPAATTGKQAKPALADTLNFSNTTLPKVMNRLSAYYNVNISYDTLLIDTMNFTGTVSKSDSLPVILKAISQMNDLDISKDSTGNFSVTKHSE